MVPGRRRRLARPPSMGDAWHQSLIREDSEFSPAEAIFGSQLVLPGQFINSAKPPLPSFLNDLIKTMTGPPPPPTQHNGGGGGGGGTHGTTQHQLHQHY